MAVIKSEFNSPRLVNQLYCGNNANLKKAEEALGVAIVARENWMQFDGDDEGVKDAERFFRLLAVGRSQGIHLRSSDFGNALETFVRGEEAHLEELFKTPLIIKVKDRSIVPRTINQKRYLRFIQKHDIVFGIGPAGTGKTYLAMAAAIQAFMEKKVQKIIISRPAVEAGEALGFLPGDLTEKIEPYLRPLYDAMYDLMGVDDAQKFMEKGAVEIAPLAYMRGRTLSNAFIILDESQNTTPEQMMMFLTRLGEDSRMVITGDITQIDLPRSRMSGLKQAVRVLSDVSGVKLFYFESRDVVRHPLVSKIIDAYGHAQEDSSSSTH